MRKMIIILLVILIAGSTFAETWTCSMHPQYKLPDQGQCPICFMDLILLDESASAGVNPNALKLSKDAIALAEIETSKVEFKMVAVEVPLIGKIKIDETKTREVTAWIPGRVEKLFVDATGMSVVKGEPLLSLYSPELYSAQAELKQNSASARRRLKLWGLDDKQIDAIANSKAPVEVIDIPSPSTGVVLHKEVLQGKYVKTGDHLYTIADFSKLWLDLRAYESDLPLLSVGQTVEFSVDAIPGKKYEGIIDFIDPVLDAKSQTAGVRVVIENSGDLKPGQLVRAAAQSIIGDEDNMPLVIADSAPLLTGKRAMVYVKESDGPVYEGREVELGLHAGDYYEVISGLEEGEEVVTNGAFKIDSAMQIVAKPSMMSMTADGEIVVLDAPKCFVERLGDILNAYLEIQSALANDDNNAVTVAAKKINGTLQRVECGQDHVGGQGSVEFKKQYKVLSASVAEVLSTDDIAKRRISFKPLSETLWETLQTFGYKPEQTARWFNCPMAFDNEGGNWIQESTETSNPYYGAMMLKCGSEESKIVGEK
jgi:membrane fusion protein, copper/silver efflux system